MNWILRKYNDFEARHMARLTEVQQRDVRAIDAALKRHVWTVLGTFIALDLVLSEILRRAMNSKMDFVESVCTATVLLFSIGIVVLGAWAGPQKYAGKSARMIALSAVIAVVGGFFGAFVGGGMDWATFVKFVDKRGFDIVMWTGAAGLAISALASGLAYLRRREIVALEAKFAAEAASREREERLQRNVTEGRLKLMQAQVEPHFLFNTLGAVRQLSEERAPEAAQLTGHLIEFLRAGLQGLREDTSTLGSELRMAEAYLAIMQARIGSRLSVSVDVPASLHHLPMPPAMLISLVENAIKHGIEPLASGGEIAIRAALEDAVEPARLVVDVIDTGMGLSAVPGAGVGLSNIRDRLALLYDGRASLVLGENLPRGFMATLNLPAELSEGVPA